MPVAASLLRPAYHNLQRTSTSALKPAHLAVVTRLGGPGRWQPGQILQESKLVFNFERPYTALPNKKLGGYHSTSKSSSYGAAGRLCRRITGTASDREDKSFIFDKSSIQAGFGYSWTVVSLLVLSVAIVFSYPELVVQDTSIVSRTRSEATAAAIEDFNPTQKYSNMTGEALPGRPGTLTREQDEKLREFWTAVLQVFGVLHGHESHVDAAGAGHVGSETASVRTKKKKFGIFGRKSRDEDASTPDSSSVDENDKYGQMKEYQETLAHTSPELLRATFWSMVKHDHPDALLLRFLRARKWDVEKALVMMVATMNWRASEMHVDDDIMRNGEERALMDSLNGKGAAQSLGKDVLTQMRMGKSYLHGSDKAGRPMCIVTARLHKQGEQSEESLERYTVFIIESARMVLSPPVDTACIVFDMSGFSLANMDYAPVKFMIKCFEANYPESLGVVLVHKAPWVFQGIWKIIKGWLDPVVAAKVNFTNSVSDLEEFIPKSHIISALGGDDPWSYHYAEPVAGENRLMEDITTRDRLLAEREHIVKEYETATVSWIENPAAENSSTVESRRNEIASRLRDDYWRLDPYVRARSYYDRTGMIQPGGRIQFYPVAAASAAAVNRESPEKARPNLDDESRNV